MNQNFALSNGSFDTDLSPLDMPYICMPTMGEIERVVDRDGTVLPEDWTGLCVTAVSTSDFWLVQSRDGRRSAVHIGRFRSVAAAVASLAA